LMKSKPSLTQVGEVFFLVFSIACFGNLAIKSALIRLLIH
jgi:hypothetical protein